MGSIATEPIELDVVIVGAGFGGVYQLKRFRDEGYKARILEAGSDFGGVWYWNAYPGARVDTHAPLYQFDAPDLWDGWSWKQRFPDHREIRAYFKHVADRWDLRKDTQFNAYVESATWDDAESKWTVKTKEGHTFKASCLSLNTGFAAKRYIPDWKGIDQFKGKFIHPSYWPHEGINLTGKKVGLVGTGATGVQIATELAPTVGQLTVFQRTINTSIPMRQVNYQEGGEKEPAQEEYPRLLKGRLDSFGGFDFSFLGRNTFDDDAATRRATYEDLWKQGDFRYWLATYQDMLFDEAANREAYNFWRDKVRAKVRDPRAQEILAPTKQPYAFGCKRVPLENGYFEIYNRDNVRLVDLRATPIAEVTERGLRTQAREEEEGGSGGGEEAGAEHELDVIVCATGYDALTGGLRQIDIRGLGGEALADRWRDGTYTHLGMAVAGFPNMFMTYAPQGPTAFCNGPVCSQLQGNWIVDIFKHMQAKGLTKINPDKAAEQQWRDEVMKLAYSSLLPTAKSVSWRSHIVASL